MKKITLLLSFIACVLVAQGQNLLTNPSFETWTNGTLPDSWAITASTGTISKVATTAPGVTGFAFQLAGCTATTTMSLKVVPPNGAANFDTNATYQLIVSYLVTSGDGTDARVWSGLITSVVGATSTTYYTVPTTHSDSLKYYIPYHGPGGSINPPSGTFGNDLNGYLLDNRTSGVWHTYTCDVVFPTGITQFDFAVRQYTGSTVIWDNFKFGVKGTLTALSTPSIDQLSVKVVKGLLTVENASTNAVEIYNAMGARAQFGTLENGSIQLNSLSKGLYVVRVGNATAKIML
jgi:hypothetical protein